MLQKDHQAIDILLAEIDIYELFAFKHCKGRKVKLALCEGNIIQGYCAFFFKLNCDSEPWLNGKAAAL